MKNTLLRPLQPDRFSKKYLIKTKDYITRLNSLRPKISKPFKPIGLV